MVTDAKFVTALEYNGRLFKTVEDVQTFRASEALENAYRGHRGIYDGRFYVLLENPRKAYEILKEIYGDR